jgi:hypothetical protein
MREVFRFDYARGQNDDVKTSNGKSISRSFAALKDDNSKEWVVRMTNEK